MLPPLPSLIVEPIVRRALVEDLGEAGDITTNAVVPHDLRASAVLAARRSGVIAGLDLARLAFELIDPAIKFKIYLSDGGHAAAGDVIASVSGLARSILMAERTALNLLSHLSGIATLTHDFVKAVKGHKAKVVCTRKTTPGLRAIEKYAVRAGGGFNHRFGLDDAILIKDNHIAIAGGIRPAIDRARTAAGHLVKIEIEVDTLTQLEEALALRPDVVLLDNMNVEELRQAVTIVGGQALAEASGGVSLETATAIAATGLDLISIGAITHSAPILDIGLDFLDG